MVPILDILSTALGNPALDTVIAESETLPGGAGAIIGLGAVVVVVLLIFVWIYAARYVKVGPNEVMVISGKKHRMRDAQGQVRTVGYRIVKGGGTFVWPVFEKAEIISLEIMTLEITTPEVYTITGVPIIVDGVAQLKIKGDDISIGTASEQFLSKSVGQIMNIAGETVQGHLRAILGTLTVEEIYKEREAFAQKVQEVATADLANMGLEIVSFTLRDIRDLHGYLAALGVPRTAQVKRDAVIGQAEADRDATIKSAEAKQAGEEIRFQAETQIAEYNRDYEMRVAEYLASINQRKAEADLAYDLQRFKTQQSVKEQEVQVVVVEKRKQIDVQEKEIERKKKELDATVERPADAEKYRVQTIAEAERYKSIAEAEGRAKAIAQVGQGEADADRARGIAVADVNKAKGIAEADVILAQGHSTAEAMELKAKAWASYNEAAIAQLFIDKMPEIARAVAEPLTKTEKIVIINSGGDGSGVGASKLTRDVADIVAQMPEVLEALTGMNIKDLIEKVPQLKSKAAEKKE